MTEPDAAVRVLHDVRIPMRDGVHLAANVYLPKESVGPAPALLWYTPYLKDGIGGLGMADVAQRFFASRGFAAVSLDFRGYGASDGIAPAAFADQEALDGHDAIEWIARQLWCSGKTGIWGASYGGNTALAIAAQRPPSLGAIVPIHAIDSEFEGAAWPHGCRGALVGEIDWGSRMIGLQLLPELRFGEGWRERWRTRIDALHQPFPFAWHTIPPETWRHWTTDIGAIEVPALAVSAWHDSYPRETLDYHARLSAPKRLVMGPWKHELPDIAVHDPIGFFEIAAGWFGHWLRGDPPPDLAPVTFFETLGRGWRTAEAFPPPTAALRTFHVRSDATLSPTLDAAAAERRYDVDPTVGLGALPWDWTTPTPLTPPDISPDDHRSATWTTEPFAEPLLITGLPVITVALRSDRPDVPVRAWLSDVRPDGSSTLIAHGWVRGRFAVHAATEVVVPLAPTSYRLPAGHRLRLCVAGSHFPALIPPPDATTFWIGAGTRVEFQVEADGAVSRPTPQWPTPVADRPGSILTAENEHLVERTLDDAVAHYRQRRVLDQRLECGGELRWQIASSATVEKARPSDVRLESRQTWRVTGRQPAIEIRLALDETLDDLRVSAEIDVDGERFFERQWSLTLGEYAWAVRR